MTCDRCDKRLEMTTPCSHLGCGLIVCLKCSGELAKLDPQFESSVDYINLLTEAKLDAWDDYMEGVNIMKERL